MNIKKTNPIGLSLIEDRFHCIKDVILSVISKIEKENTKKKIIDSTGLFFYKNIAKVDKNTIKLRLSKKTIEASNMIKISSILNNIDISDFNFSSLIILLDNDKSGLIKVERIGSDFIFMYFKDLTINESFCYNSYSFLTKEFQLEVESQKKMSEFVIRILAYLYYGDVKNVHVKSKEKIHINSFSKFLNNSSFNLTYVDTLWKNRISVDGFKVRGHFRLQSFGENRKKRKLIWIEEFSKDGYNRKATSETTNL